MSHFASQKAAAEGELTLFCLPYAGGSAAVYREWQQRLPGWIKLAPLHMPGRGVRHAMPALHAWPALLDLLLDDVVSYLQGPFAIFGHSMGGLIAVELAHAIRERHGVEPVWLGVSACKAPSRRERALHWLSCPESEFVDEVRSLNGMPEELLANREFMDLVLPFLRADFHLCGSYTYRQRVPLDCPMLVAGGAQDREIACDPVNLAAWSLETRGACEQHTLDADHFFINTHRDALIGLVAGSLARAFQLSGQSGNAFACSHA
ncbi:thioesterase II family protein [Paraburkholderia bannensis]|uniref:thioesterase II family protein n=1 Tax=Paraburkholderia bannensis TaxID=765414 RepID=UPI00048A369F|nr:alpha/beta fold hydrolase [Paraburkholderia bannensis]